MPRTIAIAHSLAAHTRTACGPGGVTSLTRQRRLDRRVRNRHPSIPIRTSTVRDLAHPRSACLSLPPSLPPPIPVFALIPYHAIHRACLSASLALLAAPRSCMPPFSRTLLYSYSPFVSRCQLTRSGSVADILSPPFIAISTASIHPSSVVAPSLFYQFVSPPLITLHGPGSRSTIPHIIR